MSQQTLNAAVLIYPLLDGDVSTGANISAQKIQQQKVVYTDFGLDRDDTPVAVHKTVFCCTSSGTLRSFGALLADTGTTVDVDFDLKVNNSSVLTSTLNITNSETDNTVYYGTITSSSVSSGDIVSIELTVTTSTGALGPFAKVYIDQSAVS